MTDEEIDLDGAVTVAFINNGITTDTSFFNSWTTLVAHDMANHARMLRGGYRPYKAGTDGLVECRNKAVAEFIAESGADWLMWLDTDMGYEPDLVDRLIEAADPVERPIVGALCFASIHEKPDGFGGWEAKIVPTVFDWAQDGEQHGFAVRWDYPTNTMTRCHGTGSAAILIHRSVFLRMAAARAAIHDEGGTDFGAWYDRRINPSTGQLIAEDLSFCIRAAALDIPVFVHTGVQTSHAKTLWLTEKLYWEQRAVRPAPWKPEPANA